MSREQEFYNELSSYMQKQPQMRYGQDVWNLMSRLHPQLAEKYRGTDNDPFYDDSKAARFIELCFSG